MLTARSSRTAVLIASNSGPGWTKKGSTLGIDTLSGSGMTTLPPMEKKVSRYAVHRRDADRYRFIAANRAMAATNRPTVATFMRSTPGTISTQG